MVYLLNLLPVIALAIFAIVASYRNRLWYAFLKATPMVYLLLYFAFFFSEKQSKLYNSEYQWLLLFVPIALVFGTLGDLLLLRKRFFLLGLLSFLMGHLSYICAFYILPIDLANSELIISGVIGFSYFALLSYHLFRSQRKKLIVPVLFYIVAILTMALSARNWQLNHAINEPWVVIGALLFCVSDGILSWNRFIKEFKPAQALILITYYIAQALLVFASIDFLLQTC